MLACRLAVLLFCGPVAVVAQTAAIVGGSVVDLDGGPPIRNAVVLIVDGRITAVGPAGTTLLFEVTVDDTRGGVAESVVSVPVADVPAPTRDIVSLSDDDMVPACGICGPIGFVGFSGMLCGWLALNLFTPSRNRRRRR